MFLQFYIKSNEYTCPQDSVLLSTDRPRLKQAPFVQPTSQNEALLHFSGTRLSRQSSLLRHSQLGVCGWRRLALPFHGWFLSGHFFIDEKKIYLFIRYVFINMVLCPLCVPLRLMLRAPQFGRSIINSLRGKLLCKGHRCREARSPQQQPKVHI